MKKRWLVRDDASLERVIAGLEDSLGVSHLVAKLLAQRGVETYEDAYRFFRPELTHLHDPFRMRDMDRAVARLSEAVRRGERVLVYGDYDVDGTTAISLVYMCLRDMGVEVDYYVPDRYLEGYGISEQGLRYAVEKGISLVIALDCGIKAVERMEQAERLGLDFIICDHHLPGDRVPSACAVLDPKRTDCGYPFKELSGCAVGFKLMQAYYAEHDLPFSDLCRYLDLVAVSLASDIVEISGENRVLMHYGLARLNENPSAGLQALLQVCGLLGHRLRVDNIVFKLGPRINAAGRMQSGRLAVELLTEQDPVRARMLAGQINQQNEERQDVDRSITHEALRMIGSSSFLSHSKSTVLFHPGWNKGVLGIVASRLTETYYRPTIVLTESNGIASGSARSVSDFDLYAAISACDDLLTTYGGHRYAAGLSLEIGKVQEFIERFEQEVRSRITPEQEMPVVEIDALISFQDIDARFLRILSQFEPFGPGNLSPIFMVDGVLPSRDARIVGKTQEHMLFTGRQSLDGPAFRCIAFQLAGQMPLVSSSAFKMCFSVERNTYRQSTELQLKVRDIKPMDGM